MSSRTEEFQAACSLVEDCLREGYGVLDMTVLNGAIVDLAFISIRTLRARYGAPATENAA